MLSTLTGAPPMAIGGEKGVGGNGKACTALRPMTVPR